MMILGVLALLGMGCAAGLSAAGRERPAVWSALAVTGSFAALAVMHAEAGDWLRAGWCAFAAGVWAVALGARLRMRGRAARRNRAGNDDRSEREA